MAFAFDGHSFGEVLDDAEQVARHARDVEQRLVEVVEVLDSDQTDGNPVPSLLRTLRELCVEARNYRERADTLVTNLAGTVGHTNGSAKRRRVLVVDDAEDNRELVSVVLEHAGFEALTASDGLEAVIVAHYARPDLILMDVTMPVLNGIDAARLLKASAVTQDVNVIAYTARPDFEELAYNQLFVDVLKKPAAPDAILASVERFISHDDSPNR